MAEQDKLGAVERKKLRVVWGGTPRISFVERASGSLSIINSRVAARRENFLFLEILGERSAPLLREKRLWRLATRARHEFIHLLNF